MPGTFARRAASFSSRTTMSTGTPMSPSANLKRTDSAVRSATSRSMTIAVGAALAASGRAEQDHARRLSGGPKHDISREVDQIVSGGHKGKLPNGGDIEAPPSAHRGARERRRNAGGRMGPRRHCSGDCSGGDPQWLCRALIEAIHRVSKTLTRGSIPRSPAPCCRSPRVGPSFEDRFARQTARVSAAGV